MQFKPSPPKKSEIVTLAVLRQSISDANVVQAAKNVSPTQILVYMTGSTNFYVPSTPASHKFLQSVGIDVK